MKTSLIFSAFMLIGSLVFATGEPTALENIDVAKSTITWTGKKVTGEHTGAISLKSGNLSFKNGRLSGGTFEVDMNTITNADMEGEWSDKLVGHLKSDDFFGVKNHAVSTLKITKVSMGKNGNFDVTADLTIKGKTNPVSFSVKADGNTYSTKITVDRTLYNVKYGSGKFFDGLGDKMIYDNFELDVKLVTS
mgnify:CR=1 FL=1